MDFIKAAEKIEHEIIALRRHFHEHPELSLHEINTSRFVCAELDALAIPYVQLADNAVVAKLQGGKTQSKSKAIAIRADMDALPITEETGLDFASQNPGVMHACGHDAHTAILLGSIKLLADIREKIEGTVYFCFQPAEEVQAGSALILDYLASEGGVDRVIAAHVWPELPSGEISVMEGARMAAGDFFTIEVFGQGGHCSRPDLCIDPIKPLCDIVLKLSALPTNRIKTTEPSVVHIGKIEAGTVGNVFPQSAKAYGGTRTFSKASREKMRTLLSEVSTHTAAAYGAHAVVDMRSGTPPLINDAASVDLAKELILQSGIFILKDLEPILASEDFGFYLEKHPGFMCFVGTRNEEKGITHTLHHPKFDLDEAILARTSAFFALYAFEFLTAGV